LREVDGIALLQGEVITIEQIYTDNFVEIFSRTSKPKLIKLGTHYPWLKGIQVCSIKAVRSNCKKKIFGPEKTELDSDTGIFMRLWNVKNVSAVLSTIIQF
jgi:hypothetical protein